MEITLKNPRISGNIEAIPSKSFAHRALICAALSDGVTKLRCSRVNRDIEATVSCLNSLGAEITEKDGIFTIEPIKNVPRSAVLHPCESGSTLRFLLPVASALGIECEFVTEGRLGSRPLSPLKEELIGHGVQFFSDPIKIVGKLTGGRFVIDGSVSSQFITGLMLSLPIIGGDNSIEITGKLESKPYIDLTAAVLKKFGVDADSYISENGTVIYYIRGSFSSAGTLDTEGDWSNAAFMLCAGALSEDGVTVSGLDRFSTQGDRAIFDILRGFGAECSCNGDRFFVRRGEMRGLEIDAADIPDLVPIISVIASVAEGRTVIKNCGRLRLKESDRIESVCAMITSLGGEIKSVGDDIFIYGKKNLSGKSTAVVDSFNDHRIVMSAAVAASVFEGEVVIRGAEAVGKSYPDFFADLEKISW